MADASPPEQPEPTRRPQDRRSGRRSSVALAFGIAAVAACWNPFAAPFGLIVGIVAFVLALRALRRSGGRRWVPMMALAFSVVAVAASLVVIAATTGVVGVELPGQPVVQGRTRAELNEVLSQSAERTRARREKAMQELDALGGADGGPPTPKAPPDGGTPARGGRHR